MVQTTDHSERAIQSLLIVGIKDPIPLTGNWLIVAVMILVLCFLDSVAPTAVEEF